MFQAYLMGISRRLLPRNKNRRKFLRHYFIFQLGIAPLLDNDPKDKYYYEIVVVTGMRRNAGTDSRVGIDVIGRCIVISVYTLHEFFVMFIYELRVLNGRLC